MGYRRPPRAASMPFGSKRRADGPWAGRSRGGTPSAMDMAAQVLRLAQETADLAIADAHAEAARILEAARDQAAQIIAEARGQLPPA